MQGHKITLLAEVEGRVNGIATIPHKKDELFFTTDTGFYKLSKTIEGWYKSELLAKGTFRGIIADGLDFLLCEYRKRKLIHYSSSQKKMDALTGEYVWPRGITRDNTGCLYVVDRYQVTKIQTSEKDII